ASAAIRRRWQGIPADPLERSPGHPMAVGSTRAAPLVRAQSPRAITTAGASDADDAIVLDSLYRLSVAQYHAMIEAGILTEEDSVELLEGILLSKMPEKPPHIVATELLQRVLSRVVPDGWYVS